MSIGLPSIEDLDLRGKRVLLRADLNVTFEPGTTEISDDSRILASIATVDLLRNLGAKVIVCSHLGRPKGRVVPEMRIEPVRLRTSEVLGTDVKYVGGPVGKGVANAVGALSSGDVAILENLRFHPGEEANDGEFSKALANLADVYVNDAFGASHRSHASIVGVARILPTYAGLLMRAEIDALNRAVMSDERPAVAILGGAKVADKLGVLKNLAPNVDAILVGGGMIAALLAAQGRPVGSAKVGPNELAAAAQLLEDDDVIRKLILPEDVVVADEFDELSDFHAVDVEDMPQHGYVLDIGPRTITNYVGFVNDARKIVWNGPMGLFEWSSFANGTKSLANAISGNVDAFKLAGGGSTVEAINSFGIAQNLTHVSTGGGASLEYLEGKPLPGIVALFEG